ncbi:hypothetical protein H2200_002720 [Cladophialophora chaetospira]|uniref:Uncharacterized protein n=1 Tax=Cladophialophora chaetospira TaxID=386627 RepID=A0AA38XK75_9EURO|nr:hypothetical protein H2200_002720 [Cladophialophora chaetospira]
MPTRKQRRQGRSSSSTESVGSKGRGRPLKRAAELKSSRKDRTKQEQLISKSLAAEAVEAAKAATPKPRILSQMEQFPNEVLHPIFFYCLELNLPRASPHLAERFSDRKIYTALVLLAYYEAESEAGILETEHFETKHFEPAKYRRIVRDERVRLQESIVRCRWFNLDLFETCLPILSRLKMVECWCREERALKAMIRRRSPTRQATLPSLDINLLLPNLADTPATELYFRARMQHYREEIERNDQLQPPGCFDPTIGPCDDNGCLPFIITTTGWSENGFPATRQGRTVLTVRVLPDQLLQGAPWTDSKIRMLLYLRQGLRYEAHDRNLIVSLDAVFSGMANAITEGNGRALLVLLELFVTVLKYPATVRDETSDPIYPSLNVLPMSLFHLACQRAAPTAREPFGIMPLLFRAGVEGIPADDVVMTRWATHVLSSSSSSHEEVRLAQWLLFHMEKRGSTTGTSHLSDGDYVYRQPPNGLPFTNRVGYLRQDCPTDIPWSINPTHERVRFD